MQGWAKLRLAKAFAVTMRHFDLEDEEVAGADRAAKGDAWQALTCYEAIVRSLAPR